MKVCPYCKSRNIVSAGYRYNRSGKKNIEKCKKCGRKFTDDKKFLRMRFKKNHIMKAVELNKKLSLSETANYMLNYYNVKVSRWTISKWSKRYRL